jgi:hypothetical protein
MRSRSGRLCQPCCGCDGRSELETFQWRGQGELGVQTVDGSPMEPTVPRYRPRVAGHDAATDATSAGACTLGGERGVEPGASRSRASRRARGGDRARAPVGGTGGRAGGLFDAPRRSPAAGVCAAAESVAAARAPDSGCGAARTLGDGPARSVRPLARRSRLELAGTSGERRAPDAPGGGVVSGRRRARPGAALARRACVARREPNEGRGSMSRCPACRAFDAAERAALEGARRCRSTRCRGTRARASPRSR